jgi:hypothetical protein
MSAIVKTMTAPKKPTKERWGSSIAADEEHESDHETGEAHEREDEFRCHDKWVRWINATQSREVRARHHEVGPRRVEQGHDDIEDQDDREEQQESTNAGLLRRDHPELASRHAGESMSQG